MARLTLHQRLEAYISGFDLLFEGLKKQIDNSDDATFIKQKLRELEINTMIHKHLLEVLEFDTSDNTVSIETCQETDYPNMLRIKKPLLKHLKYMIEQLETRIDRD